MNVAKERGYKRGMWQKREAIKDECGKKEGL